MPDDLDPNRDYFFGVVVDSRYDVAEVDEGNNYSYVNIRTINFPTPTPTPTRTPFPTRTPTPTIDPNDIVIPTFTPTPPPPIEFVIKPDWLQVFRQDFEELTVPIPGTIRVHVDPNTGMKPIESIYFIEGGDYGNNPSVLLTDGNLLTVAQKQDDMTPMLIIIDNNGVIREFAKFNPLSVVLQNTSMQTDNIHVLNMTYDGNNNIVLLCQGHCYHSELKMSAQFNFRTMITGPFDDQTVIEEFSLY